MKNRPFGSDPAPPTDATASFLEPGQVRPRSRRLQRRRRRRARRLRFMLIVAAVVLAPGLAMVRWQGTADRPSRAVEVPPLATIPTAETLPPIGLYTLQRRAYPYSIIEGGVSSVDELRRAIDGDGVVAAHYADFDLENARIVRAGSAVRAYVSYRKNGQVFWTGKPVRISAGETLVTDGVLSARARCGNMISLTPVEPVEPTPPPLEVLNEPLLLPVASAPVAALLGLPMAAVLPGEPPMPPAEPPPVFLVPPFPLPPPGVLPMASPTPPSPDPEPPGPPAPDPEPPSPGPPNPNPPAPGPPGAPSPDPPDPGPTPDPGPRPDPPAPGPPNPGPPNPGPRDPGPNPAPPSPEPPNPGPPTPGPPDPGPTPPPDTPGPPNPGPPDPDPPRWDPPAPPTDPIPVPEPGSMLLTGTGLVAGWLARRRRARSARPGPAPEKRTAR